MIAPPRVRFEATDRWLGDLSAREFTWNPDVPLPAVGEEIDVQVHVYIGRIGPKDYPASKAANPGPPTWLHARVVRCRVRAVRQHLDLWHENSRSVVGDAVRVHIVTVDTVSEIPAPTEATT